MDPVDFNHHTIYKNNIILISSFFLSWKPILIIFGWPVHRHKGYYVFITNHTVEPNQLSSLDPVYHDNEATPSFQNTIVFPGGYYGRQIYLFVNNSNDIVIEPCEVEIFGMVLDCNQFSKKSVSIYTFISNFSNT